VQHGAVNPGFVLPPSTGSAIRLSRLAFAVFTCCQRASTPHSAVIGATMRVESIDAATIAPVVMSPLITSGAPTTTTVA
jgi:hypothetical protein